MHIFVYIYVYMYINTNYSWLSALGQTHRPDDIIVIQSLLFEATLLIEELSEDPFLYGSKSDMHVTSERI